MRQPKIYSRTRVVTEVKLSDKSNTPALDKLLATTPCVTCFDVGRQVVWFQGPLGADLRAIRRRVEQLA